MDKLLEPRLHCVAASRNDAEGSSPPPETPSIAAAPSSGTGGPLAEAARILDDIRRTMEWHPERAHAAALRLAMLLGSSGETKAKAARGGLPLWKRRKVDQHLRERLTKRLEVGELAAVAGLSIAHFHRAFKETFGDTPHAYIVRLRLELARTLMLGTPDPLSQIALACGFADQAHFTTNFRAGMGVTPSVWRRRNLMETGWNATRQRPLHRGGGSPGATAHPSAYTRLVEAAVR
jgi:AraC-like DNA-binding protein